MEIQQIEAYKQKNEQMSRSLVPLEIISSLYICHGSQRKVTAIGKS